MRKLPILALCLVFFTASVQADEFAKERLDNWHQWRGPLANGTSPHSNPPAEMGRQDQHQMEGCRCRASAASTPIVWGDLIFVLTAIDTGREAAAADIPKQDPRFQKKTTPPTTYHQFVVLAFDRKTGALRWKQIAAEDVPHEGRHPSHTYAAYSPTTDGRYLYVSLGSHGIYCYDFAGKLQWKRTDLPRLETRLGWGEGSSPALHGDVADCRRTRKVRRPCWSSTPAPDGRAGRPSATRSRPGTRHWWSSTKGARRSS